MRNKRRQGNGLKTVEKEDFNAEIAEIPEDNLRWLILPDSR